MTSTMTEIQRRAHDVALEIQAAICAGVEALEREGGGSGTFASDAWERSGGGGGLTRVLRGDVIEKGGVNTSTVFGELSPQFAGQLPGSGSTFFAAGMSLVLHPKNPHVPTVHANFRYIEHGDKRWVGGGADLTPYYYDPGDREHFHGVWRRFCDDHPGTGDYARFSEWCDRYFYLRHRGESRGIGGIFFDNLYIDPDRPGQCRHFMVVDDRTIRLLDDALEPVGAPLMRVDGR